MRLIDADEFIEYLGLNEENAKEENIGEIVTLEDFDNQPTVDVKPVRYGKWIKSEIPCEEFVCSECGGACWHYDTNRIVSKSRYCPNCGAKMKGGIDNE